MRRLLSRIKAFLTNDKVDKTDFSRKNCLVGVVKNKFQLEVNLQNNFYHVPARFIYSLDLPIDYVALYQSSNTFGEEAGIHYFGKIKSWRVVPRCEITQIPRNSTEPYFCFCVESWCKRATPVKPLETGGIVLFTNYNIFLKSEYMPELYMSSYEELRFFRFLEKVCIDYKSGIKYNYNGIRIGAYEAVIEVIYKSGEHKRFDKYSYMGKPYALYRTIMLHNKK